MTPVILLEIVTLIATILLPIIFAPKSPRIIGPGLSKYAVNRRGYLEHYIGNRLETGYEGENEGGILV
jgi:hypothetical protein